MKKRLVKNVQPGQVLNSELKADVTTSAPAIANTDVGSSPSGRGIKFRVWHRSNKLMLTTKQCAVAVGETYWNSTEGNGMVLMQYTNLNDVNGKECYEFDITNSVGGRERYKIIWHLSGWKLQSINNPKRILSLYPHILRQEVVGNEFQNPELLISKK